MSMTKAEAIRILKNKAESEEDYELSLALYVAIEALENSEKYKELLAEVRY